jgi:hypothetical protein
MGGFGEIRLGRDLSDVLEPAVFDSDRTNGE